MSRDTRPPSSPLPAEAAAHAQHVVDQLKPMLDDAYDKIAALAGPPAERENDALSMLADVASFVGAQMIVRMMMAKGHGLSVVLPIVADEIGTRMRDEISRLRSIGTPAGRC